LGNRRPELFTYIISISFGIRLGNDDLVCSYLIPTIFADMVAAVSYAFGDQCIAIF